MKLIETENSNYLKTVSNFRNKTNLIDLYTKISGHVSDQLLIELNDLKNKYEFDLIEIDIIHKERLRRDKMLRPFLFYVTVLIFRDSDLGNKYEKIIIPLMTCTEVFNISTYQSNVIFDNKLTDFNNSQSNRFSQFIYSFLNLGWAFDKIAKIGICDKSKLQVISLLNRKNTDVYAGQYLDLNILNLISYSNICEMSEKDFLKKYFERCRCLGGSTVSFAILSAYHISISGLKNSIVENSLNIIANTFGMLMQVLNDLNDFVGEMKDVREDKVTLPIYYILKELKGTDISMSKDLIKSQILQLSLDQRKHIVSKYEIEEMLRAEMKVIFKEFKLHKRMKFNYFYSIMYETLFHSSFYSNIFN